MKNKRLVVLGEVNKRFSISPDVDSLLAAMEQKEKYPSLPLDSDGLIQMDTT
jgi:DNA-directed RNA polymerase III subunit RPC4